MGASWIWYFLLISIGMAVSPGACFVLAAGMVPTLVAMVVISGHCAVQRLVTVASFNLAGVLPFVINVWTGGDTASAILTDIFSWMVMLGAAGCGTLINYVGPIVAAQVLTGMAKSDQAVLAQARKKQIGRAHV